MKISPDDKKKLQTLLQQYEAECEIERIREQQRKEAEEKARQEAEEKARKEAEEKARKEAETMRGCLILVGIIASICFFGFANVIMFVLRFIVFFLGVVAVSSIVTLGLIEKVREDVAGLLLTIIALGITIASYFPSSTFYVKP